MVENGIDCVIRVIIKRMELAPNQAHLQAQLVTAAANVLPGNNRRGVKIS